MNLDSSTINLVSMKLFEIITHNSVAVRMKIRVQMRRFNQLQFTWTVFYHKYFGKADHLNYCSHFNEAQSN